MVYKARSRQVHLDFHTSGLIDNVGNDFDKNEFINTLKKAMVNSITCFARCHHGYLYYDSKINSERVHPTLTNKNLLNAQIEVCNENDIKVPIYTTVQWDNFTYNEHPEWVMKNLDGSIIKGEGGKEGFYEFLCVNTEYKEFLKLHIKDILDNFPSADGLFFDILMVQPCACNNCKGDMTARGIDYTNKGERLKFSFNMLNKFKFEMSEFIRSINNEIPIFYNGSHVSPSLKDSLDCYSHIEIESLPGGGWGYMHFPITARYARNLSKDCVGMTGKFHTYWGDFHSFKNQAALEYECFHMLAQTVKCSIGDQLVPSGKISEHVYDLIGSVYSQIEEREPWCEDAKAICEVAIFTTEEFINYDDERPFKMQECMIGATRMLQEASVQFDIIDSTMEFSKYRLLILPERIPVNNEFRDKLENFASLGGKIIALNESALDKNTGEFNLPLLNISYEGEGEFTPSFIYPTGEISKGIYNTEYVMYEGSTKISTVDGEVLSNTIESYFNRTQEHFCSHQHSPSSGKIYGPAIVKTDSSIYFTHKLFSQYSVYGSIWCKKIIINAIDILLGRRLIRHDGPSSLITTLNNQEEKSRYILHLLHYIPERRSQKIDVIEDRIPLHHLNVRLNLDKEIKSVKLVPSNKELIYKIIDGNLDIHIDKVDGHQMVELSY